MTDDAQPPLRWRWLQWVLVPLLMVGVLEVAARPWAAEREAGYHMLLTYPPAERVDAVFLGVSRVEAAVDPGVFEKHASRLLDRRVHCLNLGRGGRSPHIHYFGLRNLLEAYPERFDGCTVFVEAPCGLPAYERLDRPWFNGSPSRQLVAQLRARDIDEALDVHRDVGDRLALMGTWAERTSHLVFYRQLVRRRLTDKLHDTAMLMADRAGLGHRPRREAPLEVRTDGAIRVEAGAREAGRAIADQVVAGAENQQPLGDWDQSVLMEIKRLVEGRGGRLIIFRTTMHSYLRQPYETAIRQTDRRFFKDWCRRHGVPMLPLPRAYADEEFPDLWHLHRSLASEFSRNLAEHWVRHTASAKPSQLSRMDRDGDRSLQ